MPHLSRLSKATALAVLALTSAVAPAQAKQGPYRSWCSPPTDGATSGDC